MPNGSSTFSNRKTEGAVNEGHSLLEAMCTQSAVKGQAQGLHLVELVRRDKVLSRGSARRMPVVDRLCLSLTRDRHGILLVKGYNHMALRWYSTILII